MTTQAQLEAPIRRAFDWGSFLRAPLRVRLDDAVGRKEWLHFSLATPDIDLVVNFSLGDDCRAAAAPETQVARVVCLARTDHWEGDIEQFDEGAFHFDDHDIHLRAGDSGVDTEHGGLRVRVRMQRRPLSVDLHFRPAALPTIVSNIQLGTGAPWQWFVAPRMVVDGSVTIGPRTFDIHEAPGYHDHNWGHFLWGDDFAWTWGYGHAGEWALTLNCISNRSETIDYGRSLLLWKGPRQHRIFSGKSVSLREDGFFSPRSSLTVPRALTLLAPGTVVDVPARLHAEARAGDDVLVVDFEPRHVCRIVVPNDANPGVTTIHEVTGAVVLDGRCHGAPVRGTGAGTFEFLDG